MRRISLDKRKELSDSVDHKWFLKIPHGTPEQERASIDSLIFDDDGKVRSDDFVYMHLEQWIPAVQPLSEPSQKYFGKKMRELYSAPEKRYIDSLILDENGQKRPDDFIFENLPRWIPNVQMLSKPSQDYFVKLMEDQYPDAVKRYEASKNQTR